jgi:hypothetical protein
VKIVKVASGDGAVIWLDSVTEVRELLEGIEGSQNDTAREAKAELIRIWHG